MGPVSELIDGQIISPSLANCLVGPTDRQKDSDYPQPEAERRRDDLLKRLLHTTEATPEVRARALDAEERLSR